MLDYNLEKRRFVIGGVATAIVVIYMIRLFTLQIMSDDYKKNADSNAFLKHIEFPARGAIYDRNGKLLVYNQPSYDLMVVMNEESGRLDTMDFCNSLGITKEFFIKRMNDIKDRSKNPGYSRYTQQLFMGQLSDRDFSVFQEKMFRFPGFYVQKRTVREYTILMLPMCWVMWVRFRKAILKMMTTIRLVTISENWVSRSFMRSSCVVRRV